MNKSTFLQIAAILISALPVRAASSCEAVVAAVLKVLQVPAHLYMTETAGFNGGKTRNAETIYLNDITYVMVNGLWRKSPISTKELMEEKQQTEQKTGPCAVIRDEAVNGEPATVYKVHSQTVDDTVDTQIWISKLAAAPAAGVTLKSVMNTRT
jgi:hypothetical protein